MAGLVPAIHVFIQKEILYSGEIQEEILYSGEIRGCPA
jgi:hypothetical protein